MLREISNLILFDLVGRLPVVPARARARSRVRAISLVPGWRFRLPVSHFLLPGSTLQVAREHSFKHYHVNLG